MYEPLIFVLLSLFDDALFDLLLIRHSQLAEEQKQQINPPSYNFRSFYEGFKAD